MKTAALSFFAASAILTALLAACFNPITAVPPQSGDSVTDPSSAIPGEAGGAGIPDTGAFTVTIAVNPVSGGDAGRAAWLESTVIQTGGVRNTFLLVALVDDETKEVAGFWEGDKETADSDETKVEVSLPSGTYNFLLLLGHRERSYAAETGGKCVYKAGDPTLLAAGFEKETINTETTTAVTITMKPVTVKAKFTSTAPDKSVEADTKGVELERADDWKLTWTVGAEEGLKALKDAQAAGSGDPYPLFRNVTAWRTDGTVAGFSSDASFDYSTDGTGRITLNLGDAPKGAPCAAWFNLEYAPFSLAAGQWAAPVWVIRNGVNDLPQNDKTDFSLSGDKIKWDGTINGNGAVRFTLPFPLVSHLDLTDKVPKPAADRVPTQTVADSQYTGTVRWENLDGTPFYGLFGADYYVAWVTLYALSGYTFNGLGENSFRYNPQYLITNPAGMGDTLEVRIGLRVVTDLDLTNYISPMVTWTDGSAQYTGTVTSGTPEFDGEYTATVTLTAKPGYTFATIPAKPPATTGGFTHSGANSVTHVAGEADKDLTVAVVFPPLPANAEGGDKIEAIKVGGTYYEIHTFTTVGMDTLTFSDTAQRPATVEVLVVAGGGGGGSTGQKGQSFHRAGGGGAGRYIYASAYPVTSADPISVAVGGGGIGGTGQGKHGGTGDDSKFGDITAPGGGGGAGGGGNGPAAAAQGALGGKGRSSDISGESKWYAGGGAGGAEVLSTWSNAADYHFDSPLVSEERPFTPGQHCEKW